MTNAKQILNLKNIIIDNLSPLINNDFVLLDTPNHRNIGDSLIWKGELEFFKNLKYNLLYQANSYTCIDSKISENSVILLHGGGNFGDIYASSQNFRLSIIEKFKNNRIIILPQSVYYNDSVKMVNDLAIMNNHKNLYICVRDKESYANLSLLFDEARLLLLPDMAFCLDLSKYYVNNKTGRTLFIKRTDSERMNMVDFDVTEVVKETNCIDELDWPTYSNNKYINSFLTKTDDIESKMSNYLKDVPIISRFIDPAFGFKSNKNLDNYLTKGILFINKYDKVVTTRLHGLILSILLNKKVYMLDNSYGKCKRFHDVWLKDFTGIELLNDKVIE